jgi:hypothetical protein
MDNGSATLLSCLSLVLWLVIIAFRLTWISKHLMPRNPLLRRAIRAALRLMFVSPFRAMSQTGRWLVNAVHNTRPDYRRHQLFFERYPVSPLELYQAIDDVFTRRPIIGIEISLVSRLEWHLLSTRRTYMLLRFRDAVCFISAVPVGTGLLVSWRYAAMPSRFSMILFEIPYFGFIIERMISPPTFYRTDIYDALEQAIRGRVVEATNILENRGVRPLTQAEQRPLLREFYR